jgi:hypothetical protein
MWRYVERIVPREDGALHISLSQGYTLEIEPFDNAEPNNEQWRFMPKDKGEDHFVVWGNLGDKSDVRSH